MTSPPRLHPADGHNRRLLDHVHPSDWVNPTPRGRYNLVVIGAGSGGLISASIAAGLGARVALVERHLLGGDCLNYGCVPSKAVLRSAHLAHLTGSAPSEADFAEAMERMRGVRAEISAEDSASRYSGELGVEVFLGDARFTGPDRVEVDGTTLEFSRAIIATGAKPVVPPIPGLEDAGCLTNESVFSLVERPPRLAVIGAGPIGCELAQAFQRLGTQVTLLNDTTHVLPREDLDAAQLVQAAFLREGIELVMGCRIEAVAKDPRGKVLRYTVGGAEHEVVVDEILVGAGRAPNVADLGLEAAGVGFDPKDGVHVDDRLRTSNRRIYAVGDCCMRWKFTHAADAAAKIAVQNALFFGRKKLSDLVMPWVTYTDPEVAHVGLYERDAREQGIDIDTFHVDLEKVNRAVTDGATDGFFRVHVKKGTDKIVGATIVGESAGDMLSEVTLAMVHGLGLQKIAGIIHPYPTRSEGLKAVSGAYVRSRLTPTVKGLFERFLAWRR